jgi:hypothetical protein
VNFPVLQHHLEIIQPASRKKINLDFVLVLGGRLSPAAGNHGFRPG